MSLSIVDKLYVSYQRYHLNRADRTRWATPATFNQPAVYYGMEKLPSRSTAVSGGIIKCQDLAARFPNTPHGSNILYLVSSALPVNAHALVKRAKLSGVKIVLNQNGVAYKAWYGPGWEKYNTYSKALLLMADTLIYQSNFCRQAADTFLCKYQGPTEVCYNPVDIQVFHPGQQNNSELNTLLVAGTHHHAYRIMPVLEALSRSPDHLKLLIAGPLKWHKNASLCQNELQNKIKELNLIDRVELVGAYTQDYAPDLFRKADVLVHLQYNDNCPRLVAEALASGCPVIYSKSGGTPELVGEHAGIGLEVPPSWEETHSPDPDNIASAIFAIKDQLTDMRLAARTRAENHLNLSDWLDKHNKIFDGFME
jgi:glycosyltransferase involved in cell wall biosynthesis